MRPKGEKMQKLIVAVLAVAVGIMTVGCKESPDGKEVLSTQDGEADTSALPVVTRQMLLPAYMANRTDAEEARDCAILYNTASQHDTLYCQNGNPSDARRAMTIYRKMFTECPDFSHTPEAVLAVKELEAKLNK